MADDVTEQGAASLAEQLGGVSAEQGDPVADDDALAVADGAESVAGDEVPLEWERLLASDDGIAQLAERFPTLRGKLEAERRNGENTGRQRYEAELRREQGSVRHAQQVQEQWARKYGVDLDEEDLRGLPLLVRPIEDTTRRELAARMIGATLEHFSATEGDLVRRMAEEYEGDLDKFVGFAAEATRAVHERGRQRVLEGSLADVPEGTPLRKAIDDHIAERVKRELEEEIEARQQELTQEFRQRNRPPATQRGRSPGAGNTERYLTMSAQDVAKLPEEEYRAAQNARAGVR